MAGRKNKYPTHVQPYLYTIKGWCREGLTEQEICKRLGVGKTAFNEYKNQYTELSEALKEGKQEADYRVEDSMNKLAHGFFVTEKSKKVTTKMVGGQEVTEIVEEEKERFIPPSYAAQKMWETNRTDKWKDKVNVEADIKETRFVINMTDDDEENEE